MDDATSRTIDAMHERIDAQIAHAQRLAEDSARLSAQVESTVVEVSSSDRTVTVRARPSGAVDEVALGPSAAERDPRVLGALITETVARAQRAAAERAVSEMAAILGADSPLVAETRAELERAFPGPHGGEGIRYS